MDSHGEAPLTPDEPKPGKERPAYTPGFGRRLLMFLLCLIGLVVVWTFFWLDTRK